MGTDTTTPDPKPSKLDDAKSRPHEPEDRVRRAVANDNTNGAPRPRQAPDPSPDSIVRPELVPK